MRNICIFLFFNEERCNECKDFVFSLMKAEQHVIRVNTCTRGNMLQVMLFT